MSRPVKPQPAKLVVGFFTGDKQLLNQIFNALIADFGSVDMVSPWLAFDYTRYYEAEMGCPLFRRMIAFKDLIKQDDLARIKIITNTIEKKFSQDNSRRVNLDPGYMLGERFVLATGKNYTHRIYLGLKIYADLTLIYQKGAFQTLPWTYPDYAAPDMLLFLNQVRNKYLADLKENRN